MSVDRGSPVEQDEEQHELPDEEEQALHEEEQPELQDGEQSGLQDAEQPGLQDEEQQPQDETPARRRWCLGTRLVVAGASAWLLFVLTRPWISGHWWLWVVPDLMPPILLVVIPLLFLLPIPLLRRRRLPPRARGLLLGLVGVSLIVGYPQAGFNLAALDGRGPIPPGAVKVSMWDTRVWTLVSNPDRFYNFLTSQHSDVYVLQEYMSSDNGRQDGNSIPIDDSARIHREFPGYSMATAGEFVTLSRFPIVQQTVVHANLPPPPDDIWPDYWNIRILRTDLLVSGRVLSVYNVHLPDVFSFQANPLTPSAYGLVHDYFDRREDVLRALHADVAANPNPSLVGGDLNLVAGSGELRWFSGLEDAAHASTSLYPISFWVGALQAWRLDWAFTSPGLKADRYALRGPEGMSTHRVQEVIVSFTDKK